MLPFHQITCYFLIHRVTAQPAIFKMSENSKTECRRDIGRENNLLETLTSVKKNVSNSNVSK